MYRLYWHPCDGGPSRWCSARHADEVRRNLAALSPEEMPVAGEVRIEATTGESWSIVTTVENLWVWSPPGPPAGLLASRTCTMDVLADARVRLLAATRAPLARAVSAGVLSPEQVSAIIDIVEQAARGVGPAGRDVIPDEVRPIAFEPS